MNFKRPHRVAPVINHRYFWAKKINFLSAGLILANLIMVHSSEVVTFYAMLDTLEYLHRGGRIGGAAALLGAMLQIKPVVYLVDGRVEPLAKPRTRGRAVDLMVKHMAGEVAGRPVHAAVMQGDALEEAEALMARVDREFDCVELYLTEFTPVMGAHAGPGLLGLAYYVH